MPDLPWADQIKPGRVMPGQGHCQHWTCSTLLQHNYPGFVGKCQMGLKTTLRMYACVCVSWLRRQYCLEQHITQGKEELFIYAARDKCLAIHKMTAPAPCQRGSLWNQCTSAPLQPTAGSVDTSRTNQSCMKAYVEAGKSHIYHYESTLMIHINSVTAQFHSLKTLWWRTRPAGAAWDDLYVSKQVWTLTAQTCGAVYSNWVRTAWAFGLKLSEFFSIQTAGSYSETTTESPYHRGFVDINA